jgi:hypothetical protein
MRKERMVPMILLIIVLVAIVTLPQGFARTKNFGNRPTPVPHLVHQQSAPITTKQSGNSLLVLGNSLPSNVAFATPLVYI